MPCERKSHSSASKVSPPSWASSGARLSMWQWFDAPCPLCCSPASRATTAARLAGRQPSSAVTSTESSSVACRRASSGSHTASSGSGSGQASGSTVPLLLSCSAAAALRNTCGLRASQKVTRAAAARGSCPGGSAGAASGASSSSSLCRASRADSGASSSAGTRRSRRARGVRARRKWLTARSRSPATHRLWACSSCSRRRSTPTRSEPRSLSLACCPWHSVTRCRARSYMRRAVRVSTWEATGTMRRASRASPTATSRCISRPASVGSSRRASCGGSDDAGRGIFCSACSVHRSCTSRKPVPAPAPPLGSGSTRATRKSGEPCRLAGGPSHWMHSSRSPGDPLCSRDVSSSCPCELCTRRIEGPRQGEAGSSSETIRCSLSTSSRRVVTGGGGFRAVEAARDRSRLS
mmetsp:Transcript_2662/g.4080  ORF Transcript_2662/g.4080 Transcript_2662/m.4080 type:complete len:408 (+) Transcript_2662:1138-2361(+)